MNETVTTTVDEMLATHLRTLLARYRRVHGSVRFADVVAVAVAIEEGVAALDRRGGFPPRLGNYLQSKKS